MKVSVVRVFFCLAICSVLLLALSALVEAGKPPPPPPPAGPKVVTFSVREDYDKGENLDDVALDFALCNQLEVDEMVVSFGWDDYEPSHDVYDLTWLNSFCARANQYGVKLRPYLCYTPAWAGDGNWNSPPTNIQDWYDFCYNLAYGLRNNTNIVSYEIWNEWNDAFWFNGTFAQYVSLLTNGSTAIRAAKPGMTIISGGLVWPHFEAIDAITQGTIETYYEIDPLHCYKETWPVQDALEGYFDSQYQSWYVPTINNNGEGEPVWFNEVGYSTLDRTEAQQANYTARAVGYLLSDPTSLNEVEHYCCYEIKDLDPNKPAIGDDNNYHLGITTYTRVPKLAFYTFDMLTDLLDNKTVTASDDKVTLTKVVGRFGQAYKHLLKISDGSQVLFVYDKTKTVTCYATITGIPANSCTKYNLDGTSQAWTGSNFTPGTNPVVRNIALTPGNVWIFKLTP